MDAHRYGQRIEAADDIIGRRLNGNPKHTYHHYKWYRTTIIYTRNIVKIDKSRSALYHIIIYYYNMPHTYTTRRAQTKTILLFRNS